MGEPGAPVGLGHGHPVDVGEVLVTGAEPPVVRAVVGRALGEATRKPPPHRRLRRPRRARRGRPASPSARRPPSRSWHVGLVQGQGPGSVGRAQGRRGGSWPVKASRPRDGVVVRHLVDEVPALVLHGLVDDGDRPLMSADDGGALARLVLRRGGAGSPRSRGRRRTAKGRRPPRRRARRRRRRAQPQVGPRRHPPSPSPAPPPRRVWWRRAPAEATATPRRVAERAAGDGAVPAGTVVRHRGDARPNRRRRHRRRRHRRRQGEHEREGGRDEQGGVRSVYPPPGSTARAGRECPACRYRSAGGRRPSHRLAALADPRRQLGLRRAVLGHVGSGRPGPSRTRAAAVRGRR